MLLDSLAKARLRSDVSWEPWDDRWYRPDPGAGSTFSGFPINADTALRVSTVHACTSLIAETVASLPCNLWRRLDNGGKQKAKDHPLYRVVRHQPNVWMTAMDFFGMGQAHAGLRGGIVNHIQKSKGRTNLVPLHPDLVTIEQLSSGRMRYRYRDPKGGAETVLSQEEVLHIRDLSLTGVTGLARATLAREAIAVAAAGEAFVGGFFKHDATGRLVISRKGQPPATKELRDQLKQEFQEAYAGWANRSKALHLWNEATVTEIGRELDGNFIIDPRKFQVADIARFWRVPLFMIGLEEKSTTWGTGVEQQKQGFVDFTIRPWLTRWEQAMARDLLDEDEQEEYFFEFLTEDLLRADIKTRSEALQIRRMNGVISPNEWRIIENMNPREDPGGDDYQDTPTGSAPNTSGRPAADGAAEQAGGVPVALIRDAAARIAGAEVREVDKRADRAAADGLKFVTWARGFFEGQRAYSTRVLAPLVEAYSVPGWVMEEAVSRIERTGSQVATVEGMPAGWSGQRKEEIAILIDETFRAGAAVRRAA